MTTLLWIFWPLAPGGTWQDRLSMCAYAALIFAPLALPSWGGYGARLAWNRWWEDDRYNNI